MKNKGFIALLICFLVMALVAIPTIGGCAPKAPPKEKVIKIGALIDLTGPVSPAIGKGGLPQFLAPVRYLNDTGYFGDVRVEELWEDYAFNVDRAVAAYKKMKDAGVVEVHGYTTLAMEAIQPLGTRDQILMLGNSTTDKLADPTQWHYTTAPSYTQMFVTILKWVKDNWKDTSRKPRVAQVAWDAPLGRGHIAASEEYAKRIGVDIGPWEFIPMIPLDTTPNLLRIRDAKADFVVHQYGNSASADVVMRDAKKLGILDKFTWIAGLQVSHYEGIYPAQVSDVCDGMYGINEALYPTEKDKPGIQFMTEALGRYIGPDPVLKVPYFGCTMTMWASSDLVAAEAIKLAIAKVGYEKVDGKAVKEAIDTIKDFNARGLRVPMTFGPTRRQGQASMRILKLDFNAKAWNPVSDWIDSPAKYDAQGKIALP